MKLNKVLDQLNSFEKNSFLKIINDIISNNPQNYEEIENLLSTDINRGLKDVDNDIVSKAFKLVEEEFGEYLLNQFLNTNSQLDIVSDILIP